MSQQRPQDETQEQVASGLNKAGSHVKNKAGRAMKNGVKKTAQNALAHLAKHGIAATAKAFATALISALGFLLPYIFALLVSVVFLVGMWEFFTFEWVNGPAESGAFQTESIGEDNIVIKSGGTIESIQTSLGNDVAGIFYTKYAKSGYYYTLDDDPTVIRGDLSGEIIDFEGRESMFLLSPQMLMALDLGLNKGFKIPEQFIKPVYNTCLVDDDSKSMDGYCKLLDLFEDRKVLPQGAAYVEKYFAATDAKPAGVNSSYVGNLFVRTEEKTGSVYDWGLAPIFHYKKFSEDSRVVNYAIYEVQVYNEATRKIETKLYSDLTDAQKSAYPVPVKEFGYGHAEDISKQLPKPSIKYAIDNVVSFLGTINAEVTQTWVPQGKFQQVSYIERNIMVPASDQDRLNETKLKKVCTATACYSGTSVAQIPNSVGENVYIVKDGYGTTQVSGVISIEVTSTIKLAYTKIGTLELNTVEYVNDEPNTSAIVGTEYLEDYIDLYQTYVPITGVGAKSFACYDVGGVFANTNWDTTNSNDSFTAAQVISAIDSLKSSTPSSYETSPSRCGNGQIALSITDEAMTKFYFDEMPNLQYLMIAKLLNYQLKTDENGQLAIESTLSSIDGVTKPNMTTYLNQLDVLNAKYDASVEKYAKAYGIDKNLIYAIMMTTQGNAATNTAGCSLSDGSGCGVMAVKAAITNAPLISVKNVLTGQVEEISFSESKLMVDSEYNIRMGVALLQNLLGLYENNLLLALEAYTATTRYTDMLIAEANSEKNNFMDVRWTTFRSAFKQGDPLFLERVLGNTVSDVMQFNINNEIVTADISFLRTIKAANSTALIKNLNQSLENKYFMNESLKLETIWNLMYLGQKAYDDTKHTDVAAGYRIDTKGVSIEDKQSIVHSLFAFSEGKPIQNYEGMNKEYWRTKVRNLFLSTTQRGLDVLYPAETYIGGDITGLVKLNSYLIVNRDFGIKTTDVGLLEYDDVEYQTLPGAQVLSMTDGKIIEIIQGRNGKDASIAIAATPITKEVDGKTVVEYQAKFYYENLKEINDTLKVGDTIKSGTAVGSVSSENKNRFNLAYYVNGEAVDANLIVEYVQYLVEANEVYYGEGSSRTNAEWVNGLSGMNFRDMAFAGSPAWFNPTGTGVKTAGTWSYSFGTHDAVDIGAPIGVPIKALGDGVVLDYGDITPDYNKTTVPRIASSPTKHNFMTYVMMKDGNVYTVQLIHLQQGSANVSSYTFKEGDVLGNVGDNGHSTGPHLHMSVINHGPNVSIQDIVDRYVANPGKPFFGINPRNNASDRCENKSTFPCGVPVDKYIFR